MVPSLLTGSAPPANGPPGISSTTSTSSEEPGSFARLLTAAEAATQAGSDTPTTETTTSALPTATGAMPGTAALPTDASATDGDALLAQLVALMRGIESAAVTEAVVETAELPVLDRPAEAGEITEAPEGADALDGQGAIEALMAFLVMGQRTPMDPAAMPALPEDVRALLQSLHPSIEGSSTMGSDVVVAPAADTAPIASSVVGIEAAPDGLGLLLVAADAVAEASMLTEVGAEPDVRIGDGAMPVALTSTPAEPVEVTEAPAPVATAAADTRSDNDASSDRPASSSAPLDIEVGMPSGEAVTASQDVAVVQTQPSTVTTGFISAVDAPVAARVVTAAEMPSAVADSVQSAVLAGESEVRLVLTPPDLGHLDVTVSSIDGALRVRVEASQAATRDLLEQSMPLLHQALEARELRVDRLEVRATDTGRGSLDTSGSGERSGFGGGDSSDGQPDWSPLASVDGIAMDGVASPLKSAQATAGRLDVMA